MNWHQSFRKSMGMGDRIAEWMSRRIGSMFSIFGHTLAFIACFEAVWLREIPLNDMLLWLTTIVSLEAIYIGLFLQNSSNRHGDANEHQAAEDYRVNTIASRNIDIHYALTQKMDEKLDQLIGLAVVPEMKKRKTVRGKKL